MDIVLIYMFNSIILEHGLLEKSSIGGKKHFLNLLGIIPPKNNIIIR